MPPRTGYPAFAGYDKNQKQKREAAFAVGALDPGVPYESRWAPYVRIHGPGQGQFPEGSIRPRGYMAPDERRSLARVNVGGVAKRCQPQSRRGARLLHLSQRERSPRIVRSEAGEGLRSSIVQVPLTRIASFDAIRPPPAGRGEERYVPDDGSYPIAIPPPIVRLSAWVV